MREETVAQSSKSSPFERRDPLSFSPPRRGRLKRGFKEEFFRKCATADSLLRNRRRLGKFEGLILGLALLTQGCMLGPNFKTPDVL